MIVDFCGVLKTRGTSVIPSMAELSQNGIDVAQVQWGRSARLSSEEDLPDLLRTSLKVCNNELCEISNKERMVSKPSQGVL